MSNITHQQLAGESDTGINAKVFAMNEAILNLVANLTDETGVMLYVEVALQPAENNPLHSQYAINTKIVGIEKVSA